jgi:hypothetical protein
MVSVTSRDKNHAMTESRDIDMTESRDIDMTESRDIDMTSQCHKITITVDKITPNQFYIVDKITRNQKSRWIQDHVRTVSSRYSDCFFA